MLKCIIIIAWYKHQITFKDQQSFWIWRKNSCVSICSQYKISSLVFFGNSLQVVSSGTGRPTNPKVFTLSFLERIWKKSCARYQMFILFLYIQQWAWLSPLVFYFLDAISVCWMVVQAKKKKKGQFPTLVSETLILSPGTNKVKMHFSFHLLDRVWAVTRCKHCPLSSFHLDLLSFLGPKQSIYI